MRASVPVFPPRRQRPVAPSPSPSIWCRLVKTPKSRFALSEPAPLCRDVAQPGRALAWGARGREFKSPRPDHSLLSATPFASASTSQLPTPSTPTCVAAKRKRTSQACEGRSTKRSGIERFREFKSPRPDHSLLSATPFASAPTSQLPTPSTPTCVAAKRKRTSQACEGRSTERSGIERFREFKSPRPDHLISFPP